MAACFLFMWLHVNLELDQQNEAVDALGCGESAAQEQKDQTCVSWESRISCLWGVLTSWHMDRCVIAFFCWAGNRGPLVFDAAQYLLRHHFWPPTMSNEKKRALGHRAVDHWEDFQREHMRAKCKEAYFNPGLCILMLSVYPLSLSLCLSLCLSLYIHLYTRGGDDCGTESRFALCHACLKLSNLSSLSSLSPPSFHINYMQSLKSLTPPHPFTSCVNSKYHDIGTTACQHGTQGKHKAPQW